MKSRLGFILGFLVESFSAPSAGQAQKDVSSVDSCRSAMRYGGIYSSVARELGCSRQFVWQVATGARSTPHVREAILRELARRDQVAGEIQ